MSTLAAKVQVPEVKATGVRFTDERVYIALSDGREVGLPLNHPDLAWLATAAPEQRAKWSIEPGGFAVYWGDLDDGIEVVHVLWPQPF